MTFPNPFKLAWALLVVAYAKRRGYAIMATPKEMKYRYKRCSSCVHNPEGFQCQLCTCLLDAKIALNTERCPVGYWERIWRKVDP
jgi:hypothetical protein